MWSFDLSGTSKRKVSESRQLGHRRRAGNSVLAVVALLCVACFGLNARARGQVPPTPTANHSNPLPPGTPQSWIAAAAQHQLAILQDESLPLRYRTHKANQKEDVTRVVIESRQGNVARLVERDGRPLTAAEDAAERSRLNDILRSPNDYLKHEKKDRVGLDYAVQLIKLMPRAMIYTYTPGQPQPEDAKSPQVVIDFRPNPAFKPPTMISEVLTGLEGRLWIDARTGRMTRAQAHLLNTVNVAWGVIAKIYSGGTVELEQTRVDGNRWVYTHFEENLTMREMMVRSVTDNTKMTAWDFKPLPTPLSFQDAVRELLAMPVKLQ